MNPQLCYVVKNGQKVSEAMIKEQADAAAAELKRVLESSGSSSSTVVVVPLLLG